MHLCILSHDIFACKEYRDDVQRCINCLRLQVSFGEGATNYRALLRKETYKDKAAACKDIV